MFKEKKGINISHNEAVNKEKIYPDSSNNIMLSDYRPGNLFWDTQIGNMQQQDFTIDEYWEEINKRIKRRIKLRQQQML